MKATSVLASVLLLSSAAFAVKTEYWTHSSQEQFNEGTPEQLVITNHGELRLSRELKSLLPDDKPVDAVQAIAKAPDDSIVFATYPDGQVLRYKQGKIETVADLKKKTVTALLCEADGSVLVATTGERAEVLRLASGKEPQKVFSQAGVQYVWSIVRRDKQLLLATGPDAQIFETDGQADARDLARLDGYNVLSMIAAPDGTIYAGTDEDGLVYRLDPKDNKPFLLFDAAEKEISALALDEKGRLLVATGEAKQAAQQPGKPAGGGPEEEDADDKIPADKPAHPETAAAPKPGAIPADEPDAPKPVEEPKTEKPAKPEKSKPTAGPVQPAADGEAQPAAGNAVYRIDPKTGAANELFRQNVTIFGIAQQKDAILIATGDEGQVFEIRPESEEASVVARTDSAQVSGIAIAGDSVYLALSNAGGLATLSSAYAQTGTFTSEVLDATVASKFGTLQLRGQLPEKTTLTVATRSGNASDPDSGTWSDWSAEQPAKEFLSVASPAARYLQYRLTLKTTDRAASPEVDEVIVAYQKPNVAPRIASVTVTASGGPAEPRTQVIAWEAADANTDEIKYEIQVRAVGRGGWVRLAKDLPGPNYNWTAKDAADGRYQVKVIASDASDNQPGEGKTASRVSDVVLIDNSAPVIGDIKAEPAAGEAKVTLRVVDRGSTVAQLDYAVDSAEHWQRRLPDDTMADSPEERYTLSLTGLSKGPHTLTVRATDQAGNTSFETIGVEAK